MSIILWSCVFLDHRSGLNHSAEERLLKVPQTSPIAGRSFQVTCKSKFLRSRQQRSGKNYSGSSTLWNVKFWQIYIVTTMGFPSGSIFTNRRTSRQVFSLSEPTLGSWSQEISSRDSQEAKMLSTKLFRSPTGEYLRGGVMRWKW